MNLKLPSVVPPIPGIQPGADNSKPATSGIGGSFEKLLQEVNQQQLNADAKQTELMTTENKDIHGTMLALEKADLSMRLMLQVRNKLVSAYEEVIRMQV